jgi:HrpA-like RNA helicase
LEDEGVPEVLRCPLERLVLQTKLFDMGEPKALLALSLDPPDLTNLENTVLLLKEVSLLFAAADKLCIKLFSVIICNSLLLFVVLSVYFLYL